ncbi:MAG TPA: hypothetical protein VM144_13485 [Aestuariivirga sp.]|nr:hypothetical protein [Aestuariivirga sp.]
MNFFDGNAPVLSHLKAVRRNSLAWRCFIVKAPRLTLSINPRSSSICNARAAVSFEIPSEAAMPRTLITILPLFSPV